MRGLGGEEEKKKEEEEEEEEGGEGEGDETVFFVCGDEKREREKLTKGRVGRIQKCDQGGFVVQEICFEVMWFRFRGLRGR